MRHLLLNFIARLSVARKLILIYALDLSAVIFVSTILINEKFIAIDFARKEIVGNEHIGALRTATLGALTGGGPHGSADAVLEAEGRHGSARGDLGSSELAQALAGKLRRLEDADSRSAVDEHAVASALQALITRIGNQSNLILDPDLDSYYMRSLVVLRFPELLDLIGGIRDQAQTAAAAATGRRAHEQSAYLILEGRLDAVVSGIESDYAEALAAGSAELGGALQPTRQAKQADRHKRRVAVLFIDLDRFKNINDSLGHHIGDAVLRSVSNQLQRGVRSGDTVSRMGGDEFVVILNGVSDVEEIRQIVECRLIRLIRQPHNVGGAELHVSCSIGIAVYPEDGLEIETLMRNADAAMYQAKQQGRNNAQFFTLEMDRRARERMQIENDLRVAIERRQLRVSYQPRVECRSGRLLGAEALVRWRHPQHGLITPARFIPVAEDSGLIIPIDKLKIDQSFVRNMLDDPNDPAITKAVIGLGHTLGLRVVAEGVEQTEEMHVLAAAGCDELQGYLFGKPMPADDFARWRQSLGHGNGG